MNLNRLARLAISEEGFAFDPSTGESFAVNSSGLGIVRALLSGKAEAEIVEQLAVTFDQPSREVDRDYRDCVNHLTTLGLA